MGLGIEQRYHFTAHMTVVYFGNIAAELWKKSFIHLLLELNQKSIADSPTILVKHAELRKFNGVSLYYR